MTRTHFIRGAAAAWLLCLSCSASIPVESESGAEFTPSGGSVELSSSDKLCRLALKQVESQMMPSEVADLDAAQYGLLRKVAEAPPTKRNRVFVDGTDELWGTRKACWGLGPHPKFNGGLRNCSAGSPNPKRSKKGTTSTSTGSVIKLKIRGSLPKQKIGEEFRRWLPRYKDCYEQYLHRLAPASRNGKVKVHFTIGPDGTVTQASIQENGLDDSEAGECIRRLTCNLSFPEPKGGGIVVVTYPFTFASN